LVVDQPNLQFSGWAPAFGVGNQFWVGMPVVSQVIFRVKDFMNPEAPFQALYILLFFDQMAGFYQAQKRSFVSRQ
jgi:hypothetical protein